MSRESFLLELVSMKMVTPSVRHLAFKKSDGSKFDFVPGQFITFHFEADGVVMQRSYSVASIPTKTDLIEIAVSPFENGPGTKLLFGLQPGDKVETTGPFGRLVLRDENPKRYILVATGTGVTPYRAMLPELLNRIETQGAKVDLLLGVRKPEDLLYGEDFLEFAKAHPDFCFHSFYSRELPQNPTTDDHLGYVQSHFEKLNLDPSNDVIYLCGNPEMIDSAFEYLMQQQFSTAQVRREKYISPKKPSLEPAKV